MSRRLDEVDDRVLIDCRKCGASTIHTVKAAQGVIVIRMTCGKCGNVVRGLR